MKKLRVMTLVLAVITSISFAITGLDASAVTKKTSSSVAKKTTPAKTTVKGTTGKTTSVAKTAAQKTTSKAKTVAKKPVKKTTSKSTSTAKSAVKKTASKTSTKKTYTKASSKKKLIASRKSSSSRRRKVYSRGSGSTLGDGSVSKLITYAKRYIGVDYNYGRSSSSGFDCSGFTMYVYKNVDIELPHSAAAQSNLGLAVDKSDLRPGDLVFFETVRSGISHVGIYIGNQHFIHASSGEGHVTISNLANGYYATTYRGATRIINN